MLGFLLLQLLAAIPENDVFADASQAADHAH